MGRFVEAADRYQASFLPACLEDYVDADNPVRIIDAFVDELDLAELGFGRVQPASTGRPGYAPTTMLKLYVYGYLHQLSEHSLTYERSSMAGCIPGRSKEHGLRMGHRQGTAEIPCSSASKSQPCRRHRPRRRPSTVQRRCRPNCI
ncbi:hypothetical protein BG36_01825 [Aquamicrobium defluvii]|uniref:Transposase InsH N-terminal domain-containing protein n=1 Tax=Aquamicrobium defluvii TaxID=69279 RepID=A0A011TG34_9HYPH|nr:hypothetical protein BG36_01825 [Aquamicrobium defluvii]EZQ17778.1 hypothetical protein CF98_33450 [Halopseudomonas bauzanensis]